jgi:fatty-acyl-CoA synthase
MPDDVDSLPPESAKCLALRERIVGISVVGDATTLPPVDNIETGRYDLSGLVSITNGVAPPSSTVGDRRGRRPFRPGVRAG